jgi:hypothetical protein
MYSRFLRGRQGRKKLTFLADSVTDLRDQARGRTPQLERKDREAMKAFADALDDLHGTLVVADEGGLMSGREELRERLGELFGEVNRYDGRPSGSQLERVDGLEAELRGREAELGEQLEQLDALNRMLDKRDLEPLVRLTREAWQERQEGLGGSAAAASTVARAVLLSL